MIFSEVIIDRKKKFAGCEVDEEDFTTALALIAITVTSSSDKHHNEPMFLYLSLCISSLFTHFLLQILLHSPYVDKSLIESPLIGMNHGKILLGFFRYTMKEW